MADYVLLVSCLVILGALKGFNGTLDFLGIYVLGALAYVLIRIIVKNALAEALQESGLLQN